MSTEVRVYTKDKQLFASLKALPKEALLKTPVGLVPFGTRASNVFEAVHIQTLGDLIVKSRLDLLKTPQLGESTLEVIEVYLKELGLSLAAQDVTGATSGTVREIAAHTQTHVRKLEAELRSEREKVRKLSALLARAETLIQDMREVL